MPPTTTTAFSALLRRPDAIKRVYSVHRREQLKDFFKLSQGAPAVLFIGRANVGKSTLINALVERKATTIAKSGQRPGLTQELTFFSIGRPASLFLVDSPGYGARGRPEWGELLDAYLDMPNNLLRRVFILVNFEHGLVGAWDPEMLESLHRRVEAAHGVNFSYQPVFTKAEGPNATPLSLHARKLEQQIHDLAPTSLPAVYTSALQGVGITDLQRAIGQACGLDEHRTFIEEIKRANSKDDSHVPKHFAKPRSRW